MTTNDTPALRALVTGATGGIGRATCTALAESARARGLRLHIAVAASQPGARLDAEVARLTALGAQAHGLHADLADAAACESLAVEAVQRCGGLDVLVSNAGLLAPGALSGLSLADWERVFAVDARATWLLTRAARPALAQARGAVVAVATVAAHAPFPGLGAYSPAKAALLMLCRQLAQEWAGDGIRVNSVSPGLVHTPLTDPVYRDAELRRARERFVPLGRIATADDVAQAIVHLACPAASYVTGIDLRVDGGLADHLLATVPGKPPAAPARPAGGAAEP